MSEYQPASESLASDLWFVALYCIGWPVGALILMGRWMKARPGETIALIVAFTVGLCLAVYIGEMLAAMATQIKL